jgi:hypothetical protein
MLLAPITTKTIIAVSTPILSASRPKATRCRMGTRGDQPPSVQRRCLCCRRRRRPCDASHQILIGQLGRRDGYLLSERRSRWPGRSAGCRPVPSNRARQKARQLASPRSRTRSSNPVPSSEESANFWYLALQRRVVFPSSPCESSDPNYGRYRDMRTGDTLFRRA